MSSVLSVLRGFVRAVDWSSERLGRLVAVLMPAMVLVLFVEVFSRYLFNSPTSWAQESAIFMFAAIGLIGGADVMRKKQHISVDILYGALSKRAQAALDVVTALVVFFFLGLLIYYGGEKMLDAFEHGLLRPERPNLPLGFFLAFVPVGAAFLFLQTLANWIRSLCFLLSGAELDP